MRKAPRFLGIVLATIVLISSLLGIVAQPAVAAGGYHIIGSSVQVTGYGHPSLQCWIIAKKSYGWNHTTVWIWSEDCVNKSVYANGWIGKVADHYLYQYYRIKFDDGVDAWFPAELVRVYIPPLWMKGIPTLTPPIYYLPDCGVPIVTPTPDTSFRWCSRVAKWGDTYWDLGSGDKTTISAIQAKNGGRSLRAGETYLVPCN